MTGFITKRISRIDPNVYIGDCVAAADAELLDSLGIKAVVNLAAGLPNEHPEKYTYRHIPLWDDDREDIIQHLIPVLKFIHDWKARGGVLIHCAAGVSRSGAFGIAYLMETYQEDVPEALERIRVHRKEVDPSAGYLRQLKKWHLEEISDDDLVERYKLIFSPDKLYR